ncbi:iron uptake porin [Aliterella atlantica]|uniref:Membrane protein n=1 Tax=Aliterella atlantica CENA595 TaxID=1618023 RepID=A0A0D8ZSY7_9CYAN|nr:iron uptake porin [Aliterella atlantica]KJH71477.1 membrane protein [Aliterella atlantica CENA595]
MSKIFWNALKLSPVLLGATLLVAGRAQAVEASAADLVPSQNAAVSNETLQIADKPAPVVISQFAPAETETQAAPAQTETQAAPATNDSLAQVTSVSQLSDVQPTDWAFQALQSLVERYGCIAGYPDGTYRGNRALTRYEFAAGLNACLDRVNELIATATADLVSKEDLATLQRLQEEFAAELATLRGRVDALEVRTAELEANQFSTTTKLTGEVVAAVSDVFGGDAVGGGDIDADTNTTFSARARLNFNTSFTGRDLLRTRLQAANIGSFTDATGTNMTRLGFETNTENQFEIDDFFYRFPIGERIQAQVDFSNVEFHDNVYTFNPAFESSGRGAISRFGRFNPIYRQGNGGAGLTLNFNPDGAIGASIGYLAPTADSPADGTGLFDGSFAALGQISFRPSDAINIGLTYARSYDKGNGIGGVAESNAVALSGGTGSALANQPFGNVPTAANHYGVEASFRASDKLTLSGWAGLTDAENKLNNDDSATIFNYAVSLALQDFGREGSQLGLIFGQPPKVTDSDVAGGEDADTSYHIEALYRLQLTDNVAITPGLLVILNPEHNDANDTIYVGTLRTTFTF